MQSFLTCFGQGHICHKLLKLMSVKALSRWHHHAQTIYFGHISQVPHTSLDDIFLWDCRRQGGRLLWVDRRGTRHFSQRIDDWASSEAGPLKPYLVDQFYCKNRNAHKPLRRQMVTKFSIKIIK